MTPDNQAAEHRSWIRNAALIGGPLLYVLLWWMAPQSLSPEARHVLGITGWMAVWWMSETVPLVATSLLPAVLFPLLGVASSRDAIAPYANDLVFLFLGGFLLAAALERFWYLQGHWSEGRDWLARALARSDSARTSVARSIAAGSGSAGLVSSLIGR